MIDLPRPLFRLGRVTLTPGALAALEQSGEHPWHLVKRHMVGDWGVVDAEDRRANDEALKSGERILSAYEIKNGEKIWVITEADRSSTTLLLPDEY